MIKYLLTITALIFSCSSEVDPENYKYMQEGGNGVYFERENEDTIFLVLRNGSYIRYRCLDNGYLYIYSIDTNETKE